MNGLTIVHKVYDLLLILTKLMEFLLSFVCWSFQVLCEIGMDEGIRSSKTLSLGMPKAHQGNSRTTKHLSLGIPWKASPLSSTINQYITWNYIFIHHMIWVLLGAPCIIWVFTFFCFLVCHNHLWCTHFLRGTHIYSRFIRILYVLHIYLLS